MWLEAIADIGCDAVGLDWTMKIGEARRRIGDKVTCREDLILRCCLHHGSYYESKRYCLAMVLEVAMC